MLLYISGVYKSLYNPLSMLLYIYIQVSVQPTLHVTNRSLQVSVYTTHSMLLYIYQEFTSLCTTHSPCYYIYQEFTSLCTTHSPCYYIYISGVYKSVYNPLSMLLYIYQEFTSLCTIHSVSKSPSSYFRWFLHPPGRAVYSKQHPLRWYAQYYTHLSSDQNQVTECTITCVILLQIKFRF